MRKLQGFIIYKFNTARLKEDKYDVTTNLAEARERGEVIRLGDSQLLYLLRRIRGAEFDSDKLSHLETLQKRLKKKENSPENSKELARLRSEIDAILFEPSIISIKVENKNHYKHIANSGLKLNGESFVRLMSGAGNLRRNTVLMVKEELFDEVRRILDNGRYPLEKINPGKFVAYDGLYNSAGYRMEYFPNFAVVEDYEYDRMAHINWITKDDEIEVVDKELTLNCFDGQGLISPTLAEKWSEELQIGYIPSTFIIRAPFLKGQVATFDFHKYAMEKRKYETTDIWGNTVDIRFVDLLISRSQFKLASSYTSLEEYRFNCFENDFKFYVTRVSYQEPKSHVWGNYMFMQVLDLSDDDIKKITKDTLDYFKDMFGGDYKRMVLFLGGELFLHPLEDDWFDRANTITKAILINPDIAKNSYVVDYMKSNLQRRVENSYLGKLLFRGNFAPLVACPIMQTEFILGNANPDSPLDEESVYYKFWSDKRVNEIAVCRSPLTHQSEMVIRKVQTNDELKKWYKYQSTSLIYNPKSLITFNMADSDVDGDLASSFSSPEIIKGAQGGFPISYDKRSATKSDINTRDLWKTDSDGFFSKVGFYTNIASTFHTLLSRFEKDSDEYNELQRRLILLRRAQGEAIDTVKNGGAAWDVPKHWYQWVGNRSKEFSPEDREFNNSIVAEKRPAFMAHLYPKYKKRYTQEEDSMEDTARFHLLKSLDDVLENEEPSKEEQDFLSLYSRLSFFLRDLGTMNRITFFMKKMVRRIKKKSVESNDENEYRLLLSKDFNPSKNAPTEMQNLVNKYWRLRRDITVKHDKESNMNLDQVISVIRREAYETISSNGSELADLAVLASYKFGGAYSRSFVWNVFGEELVRNLLDRYGNEDGTLMVPYRNPLGDFEYLFDKFSMKEVQIGN